MKHTKMIFAVLLMTAMVLPAVAQVKKGVVFKNPDEATYAITSDTMKSSVEKVNGKNTVFYKLMNPQGKRTSKGYIKFDKKEYYEGVPDEKDERVVFSLSNAETDRPNKFNDEMLFWSWNDDADEWQLDIESGSGRSEYEHTTHFNVMLVLDCSESMGTANLDQMLKEALRVVKLFFDASKGKGKSGGARVITYLILTKEQDGAIYLLEIYDKSDASTVDVKILQKQLIDLGLSSD